MMITMTMKPAPLLLLPLIAAIAIINSSVTSSQPIKSIPTPHSNEIEAYMISSSTTATSAWNLKSTMNTTTEAGKAASTKAKAYKTKAYKTKANKSGKGATIRPYTPTMAPTGAGCFPDKSSLQSAVNIYIGERCNMNTSSQACIDLRNRWGWPRPRNRSAYSFEHLGWPT